MQFPSASKLRGIFYLFTTPVLFTTNHFCQRIYMMTLGIAIDPLVLILVFEAFNHIVLDTPH
jgi:hypothetical protein